MRPVLLAVLAGMSLVYDVWIGDFPRLRALLSIDGQLGKMVAVVGIAAVPATFLVFMFGASRRKIEFSILGIKVKGVAAAPVLWSLVFLVITRLKNATTKRNILIPPFRVVDLVLKQIRGLLQKVSLPDGWVSAAFAQLERWEEEERRKLQSFAKNQAHTLTETQTKLDKLVNGFLDGIIEKETYLKNKDELIKRKIEMEQQQTHFGQRAKLWVEPMREWLETAHKAGKLVFSNDYPDMKQLLGKIGTNHQVKDKKVGVAFMRPFDSLLSANAMRGNVGGCGEEKKKGHRPASGRCPVMSG